MTDAPQRIIDADRHVIEPIAMWREYLPPEWRDGAPYHEAPRVQQSLTERVRLYGGRGLIPLPAIMMLDGRPVWHKFSERAQVEVAAALYERPWDMETGCDPRTQLQSMDADGIELAWLYPSYASYLVAIDDMVAERASAFAHAYNSWLRDFCAVAPERLRGAGLISLHDPAQMLVELERVIGFGWTVVVLRPNPIKGRLLADPAYEPFWTACERAGIGVALHEGTHARVPTAGADRFETHFAQMACSHPLEQQLALLALIEGGVLERHPGLRVALLESGCTWLPYWLWRLDSMYEQFRGEVAQNVKQRPSQYFRRQCFIALEPGEPLSEDQIASIGADNLLFGSDFPHPDHDREIYRRLMTNDALRPETRAKILWDNPARFYRPEGSGDGA